MAKKPEPYRWFIAYVDGEGTKYLNKELARFKNRFGVKVEAYIPTVRILRKEIKNRRQFEYIPLLMNYGFFKVFGKKAPSLEVMKEMQEVVTCHRGWARDPSKFRDKPSIRRDGKSEAPLAMATDEEIARIIKAEHEMSVYSKEDIENVQIGSYVYLRGKPFDGMMAKVMKIDKKKKVVQVDLGTGGILNEITVDFDNVFYSVYSGERDDSVGNHISIDELRETKKLDRIKIRY